MKISIVIPAYNEENTIRAVLEELLSWVNERHNQDEIEVIVVDDGSSDRTPKLLDEISAIKAIHHPVNRGYGAALKTGILKATGDVVVTMDSDGQHSPKDVVRLLEELEGCDLVTGIRVGGHKSPLWRIPGKWLLNRLVSYLAGAKIPDFNCGLRAFRRETALKYLHLCPRGFSFSTTILLAFLCQDHLVKFVPITVDARSPKSHSRVTVRTGFQTILLVLRLISLFAPLKLFLPTSGLFMILGLVWGSVYVFSRRGLSMASLLFLLAGILVFFFGLLIDQIAAMRRERYE